LEQNESDENWNQSTEILVHSSLPKDWTTLKGLSKNNIIGDIDKGVSTSRKLNNFCEHMLDLYHKLNPKKI